MGGVFEMSGHYITKIDIEQVRHLENISIDLGTPMKHLILTGKNGSGKTSLLNALKVNLLSINNEDRHKVFNEYPAHIKRMQEAMNRKGITVSEKAEFQKNKDYFQGRIDQVTCGISVSFNNEEDLEQCYKQGTFITAFFPADRLTRINLPHGVEDIKLKTAYSVTDDPVPDFVKYMVHLKTQQSFAKNENDTFRWGRIEHWFREFEIALRRLMDDDSLYVKYDYRKYNFLIYQNGRRPYDFSQLSDGFSAALQIMADLLIRMDQNWLMTDQEMSREAEGAVLIDEIETHLHLELQRTILPFLTEMFPNLQFIVTTHSPFIVNSLENAVVYDLERKIIAGDGLSNVSYEGVVEGYFRADALSEKLREKFNRYKQLVEKKELSDDEYEEVIGLELYLEEIPDYLSIGIAAEYQKLKLEFRNREEHR